jgi:uncharacterized protein YjbJ (UPF0337 family)
MLTRLKKTGDSMATPRQHGVTEEAAALGDRAAGAIKDKTGELLDDPSLEHRGEEQNASGRERQEANQVVGDPDQGYVSNLYEDPAAANLAYERLRARQYAPEEIDVVMSDDTRRKHFENTEAGSKAAEGLGAGAAVGGGIGAALAAIFAVGASVAIPGVGLVVAGPIAAALAGAGAGAATGGVIGALVGAGIPEERARAYEQGIREGGVLIGTRARADEPASELKDDERGSDANSMLGLR